MKLLYTRRQFQGEMEKALAPLKQENEELRDKIAKKEFRFLDENDKFKKQLEEYKETIELQDTAMYKLNCIIDKLTEDKKLLFGAKGGLTKYNNKLQKQLEEKDKELKKIKKELNEANEKLSQRYIVKELEPVKAKNTQVMKTKSGARTSRIIKKVVENEKN